MTALEEEAEMTKDVVDAVNTREFIEQVRYNYWEKHGNAFNGPCREKKDYPNGRIPENWRNFFKSIRRSERVVAQHYPDLHKLYDELSLTIHERDMEKYSSGISTSNGREKYDIALKSCFEEMNRN